LVLCRGLFIEPERCGLENLSSKSAVDILISFAFKAPGLLFKERVLAAVGPTLLSCVKGMLKKGLIADVLGLLLPPSLDHLGIDVGALRGSYLGERIHALVDPLWAMKGISTLFTVVVGTREILLEIHQLIERVPEQLNDIGQVIKEGREGLVVPQEEDDFRNLLNDDTKNMAKLAAHLIIINETESLPVELNKFSKTTHTIAHIISGDFKKQMDALRKLCRVVNANKSWHDPHNKEMGIDESHKKRAIEVFEGNSELKPLLDAIGSHQLGAGGMLNRRFEEEHCRTDGEGRSGDS